MQFRSELNKLPYIEQPGIYTKSAARPDRKEVSRTTPAASPTVSASVMVFAAGCRERKYE